MDWEKELNYSFTNISNKDTLNGNAFGADCEQQIQKLKTKFILK